MAAKWHKAMVVFDDDMGLAEGLSRAERHRIQQRSTEARRRDLVSKLREAGLDTEADVPEATPASMLLVSGSTRAIEEMRKAPGVKKVLPMADELQVDLLAE